MGISFSGQRLTEIPEEQLIATFTGWDILQDPAVGGELANRLLGRKAGRTLTASLA